MKDFVGKDVKIVFQDGSDAKAVFGVIQSVDDFFINIIDNKSRMQSISLKSVIRIKEVTDGVY